jgi:hypothetical protein
VKIHVTYVQQTPPQAAISAVLSNPHSLHACPATTAATVALVSQIASNHAKFSSILTQHAWHCRSENTDGSGGASEGAGVTVTLCRDNRALVATAAKAGQRTAPPDSSTVAAQMNVSEPALTQDQNDDGPQPQQQQQTPRRPAAVPVSASQELRGPGEEAHLFVLELLPTPSYWSNSAVSGDKLHTLQCSVSAEESCASDLCAADWGCDDRGGGGEDHAVARMSVCTHTHLPWFVQPWFHSLRVFVDGHLRPLDEVRLPNFLLAVFVCVVASSGPSTESCSSKTVAEGMAGRAASTLSTDLMIEVRQGC